MSRFTAWLAHHRVLGAILVASCLLRIVLALQGGQYFFGDEARYNRGVSAYLAIREQRWTEVGEKLATPEHPGFLFLTTALAPLHHFSAWCAGRGDWSSMDNVYATAAHAAALLGIFSTLNLWLLHRFVLAAEGSIIEANFVVVLAAGSSTLFYYTRHLLPYDCALTAALAALILSARGSGGARAFFAGACAAACFAIYSGYWFLVPALGVALWLFTEGTIAVRVRAIAGWTAGGVGAAILFALPGMWAHGRDYIDGLLRFSGTVRQGSFAEGASLPWEFLWHAEGVRGVAIAIVIVAALMWARRRTALPPRALACLAMLGAGYFLVVLASVGLEKFVVYGRTTRPFVMLFCVLGGFALAHLLDGKPRRLLTGAGAGFLLMATPAFAGHLQMVFPGQVRQIVYQSGVPKRAVSFSGTAYVRSDLPVTRPDLALVNASALVPVRDYIGYPKGTVLFEVKHPFQYPPYQYEGHRPRERRLLRQHDASIKLIRLANPASVPDQPPEALTMQPSDISDGRH